MEFHFPLCTVSGRVTLATFSSILSVDPPNGCFSLVASRVSVHSLSLHRTLLCSANTADGCMRRRQYVNRIQIKLELYGLGFVQTETAWYLGIVLSLMMYAVSLKNKQKKKS